MRGVWKVCSLHIAALLLAAASSAEDRPWTDWGESPPRHFETYDELDSWARTTTRYGGTLYGLGPGDEFLYYVGRHHDRDGLSTESAVYRYEGVSSGYQLVLYLPREFRTTRVARVHGETLVLSQSKASAPGTLELVVPLAMLPAFRRPFSRDAGWAHMGDLEGFPDEAAAEITRDAAIGIARETLSADGLSVHTLQLRESKKWGVVWSVESVWRESSPGGGSSQRAILIDATSGEVVGDICWQWFIESSFGPGRF
jgi:hypothetical protein